MDKDVGGAADFKGGIGSQGVVFVNLEIRKGFV